MKNFKDKVAVITGAGSGMGQELALQLASEGCNIALVEWKEELLNETRELLKKHNVISSLKIFLSSSYFKIFFSRDYIDQIKKNSSVNLRTVQYDISQFCSGVIMPIMDIILEFGIFLILIILLALYDLNLTIISFFIFVTKILNSLRIFFSITY